MTLSPQFLDELRARATLSTVVGRSVKLQKAGREYRACCPFHQEKTPSFYVNDDKSFYHCFGCGAHGDVIRFLTDARGLPFMDAVKELAQAAGMELPAADPQAAQRQERASGLLDVTAAAARWFETQLAGIAGGAARAYLQRRGVSPALAQAFGLGLAPDSRGQLKAALASAGEAALIEAGLLIQVEDKDSYDRFRGRLMIPIRDPRGRPIAFGGRILGDGEPKYLNSPETPLFDKGRTLFNLDRAAPAARKAGRLIVVEGYMDVIGLAGAGIDEAVAPLGTALTEAQIARAWSVDPCPILCFDGDAAGRKAAVRAALRALPGVTPDRTLRFATLPQGQDPDDLARAGGRAAVDAVLDAAEPLVELLWRVEHDAAPLATPEARAGLKRRLADHVATIADHDVRDLYLAEYRRRFDTLFATPPRAPRRPFVPRNGGAKWTPPEAAPSESARAVGVGGIDRPLAAAICLGLARYPDLVPLMAEALAGLPFADARLSDARDAMVDAVYAGGTLERADVASILAKAGLHWNDKLDRGKALAFSFLHPDAEPGRARHDLGETIDVLATRPLIEAALVAANAAAMASTDEASFAEQQRLGQARRDAERRLMDLMQPDGLTA